MECKAKALLEKHQITKLPYEPIEGGNCQQQSFNILAELGEKDIRLIDGWTLVNGFVDVKPSEATAGANRMNHTWLEFDGWIVDWAYEEKTYTPIKTFYERFHVEVRRRFSPLEAAIHADEIQFFDRDS